jgi:dephospho-CoA kinase
MPSHIQRSQDKRLVVGISGRMGSGKTSIGKYLESTYAFQYVRYSRVLLEWFAKNSESNFNLQEIGWEVMAGGKQTELNRRLIGGITVGFDVAVDGLRHPLDFESLNKSFASSFRLLYIDSPQAARWNRLKENGRYASLEAFEIADSHPVEQQIELLRPKAAIVLQNTRTLRDLYSLLDEMIDEFKTKGH